MSKVIIIFSILDPATLLSIKLIERLCKYLNNECSNKDVKDVTRADIDNCDVLVSIRTQNYREVSVIQYAKRQGKMYCLLLDDDFLAIPDYKIRRFVQYSALSKCIKFADVLFCTNDLLGKKLQRLSSHGKFVRIDTAVNVNEMRVFEDKQDDLVKIIYYVNDGSLYSYDEIVKSIIEKMRLRDDINVEWHFIGIKPCLNENFQKIVHIYDHMNLQEFKKTLAESGFTFGIAPLLDNEFNKGKYVNKFIEYTCAGLPCIYSDVEPYSSFIRNGIDGLLVSNNDDAWVEAILKMSDCFIRKQLIDNAQSRLLSEMSYEAVFEKILEQYPPIKGYQSKSNVITIKDKYLWLHYNFAGRVIMMSDPVFRAIGRLKCEGFKSLLMYSINKARGKNG